MGFPWRPIAAISLVLSPFFAVGLPGSASALPTGSGVTTLISESIGDAVSVPSTVKFLTPTSSTASLPCLTSIAAGTNSCSPSSGVVDDGEGAQILLTDTTSSSINASGVLVQQTFPSSSALYAEFDSQSYGGGGGARTLWIVDSSVTSPTVPSSAIAGGYGETSGGLPGAVLGITFDAAGDAASTNSASCPAVGWNSATSTANQVVVRAGDTSSGRGQSGYCFVSSTAQPFGALATSTKTVGPLHQADPSTGWQHFFVSVLPPNFTSSLAELTVAVDSGDGRGLVTVLDIALPTWAWPSSTVPSTLRMGVSAVNASTSSRFDVMSLRNLRAAVVAATPVAPSSPRNLGVQWSAPTNGLVTATLSWTAPVSDGFSPITGYTAMLDGESCSPASLSSPTLSCTITAVPAGDTYTASVVAQNAVGFSSPATMTSSVAAQSQSITFSALAPAIFGAGSRTLVGSATSGQPVVFTATGSCAVVGNQLTFVSAGLCTVTATQSGTLSYAAATPVVRSLVVAPAPAVIKVASVSAVTDGLAHPVTPNVTPASVPISISYCPVTSPTQCSPVAPTSIGSYVVTVRVASTNYTAPVVTSSVDIVPSTTTLPPEAGGPRTGTNGNVSMLMQPPSDPTSDPVVQTTGRGFTPGSNVNIAVTGSETLGTFTIPPSTNPTAWSTLLAPSTNNTAVQGTVVASASLSSDLSTGNTIAFPFGGFPGTGQYFVLSMTSSGFVPGSTVSTVLHSTPLVLATGIADVNGVVTLNVPIPASYAGQSHKLVIAGTYLAATTTASADGSVTASTAIPTSLLSRLEPESQLVMTAIDETNPNNFAKSYIDINAKAVTTTTVAGSANDVLQAPPLVPTEHPEQTMKQVTNLVAVAATVAATASVAASVAGSVGAVRVPTGGGVAARPMASGSSPSSAGGGSSSGGSSGPMSTQQIGAALDDTVHENIGRGDASRWWQLPGRSVVDRVSSQWPRKIAPISPMIASSVQDGSYLRAMFGSASLVLPIAGGAAAVFNALETHGYPAPGHLVPFTIMMICGALDGWAGLTATVVTLLAGVLTGHMFSLGMLVSFSLMAAMLFGTAIIVKQIRPLIRLELATLHDRWKRAGDMVIGPLFGAFLSTQLVGASESAAGLQLPIVHSASTVGLFVGLALLLRYVLSTVSTLHFPQRLETVTAIDLDEQRAWAHRASHVLRQVFTALLLHAFLGWTWVLALLVVLQIAQGSVGGWVRGSLPTPLYRAIPRGVANIGVMAAIGTLGGRWMATLSSDGFWQVAGLLILMAVVNVLYAAVSAFDGEDYPVTWATRLAGVVVVVATALQLTGRLI